MSTTNSKPKIRGVLRQDSKPLLVSAVLLILFGGAMLLISLRVPEELADPLVPPLSATFALIAGVLLILCHRRMELLIPAAWVLVAAMCCGYVSIVNHGILALLSVLLLLLSAIGLPVNVSFDGLPQWLRMPVFNLASAVLAILAILTGIGDLAKDLFYNFVIHPGLVWPLALLMHLLLIAVAVLNFSVQAQTVAEDAAPRLAVKSVLRPGNICLRTAAWMLLLYGIGRLLFATLLVSKIGFSPLFRSLFLDIPLIAAAFLLLQKDGRESYLFAGAILLGVAVLPGAAGASALYFWTMLLPVILMVISCIGAPWNTVPRAADDRLQAPALNLAAALLLLINELAKIWYVIPKSPAYPDMEMLGPARYYALLALLLPLGLLLLNLSLGSRATERQRRRGPSGEEYRRGISGLVRWIYGDVGGHLQMLAKIQGIIFLITAALSILAAALGAFGFFVSMASGGEMGEDLVMLLIVGGCGFLASLLLVICTWPLYAFGQITSDVHALRETGGGTVHAPQEVNPDELPEL